jgi:outer membrane protein OmpA-like peptidoglycan-associated protein
MRKIIFYLLLASSLMYACSPSRHTINHPFNFTEKDTIMGLNNKAFSRASVVGFNGAYLINLEKEKAAQRKKSEFEKNIKEIPDVDITVEKEGKEIKAVIKNDILFTFDSFELKEKPKETLNELAFAFKDFDDKGLLKIVGHTDNVGNKNYNDTLSLKRAESVANYLATVGIDSTLIKTYGEGMAHPVSDNKTEEERAQNRRVEIFFYPNN